MKIASRYTFRRATVDDLNPLLDWQAQPDVREWWDTTEPSHAKDFDDARVVRCIVGLGDQLIGYMQDYTVHGWDDHHFRDLSKGSRGIDQFIGELTMTGKGHGPSFIAQRLQTLFEEGAPVVATDPHPNNRRAIAAYKKAGFKKFRPAEKTPWGLVLPMAVYP